MSSLFKDIKGELSPDHLEILLVMYDFKNPQLSEMLDFLISEQKAQFTEFQQSTQARQLRTFWVTHMPFVDFCDLPETLDDTLVNKIYAYYKRHIVWKGVSSMLTLSQLLQVTRKDSAVQREEYIKMLAAMTEEEKQQEAEKWRKIKEDPIPRFYGNMGEPETREEYERKYGGKK
jgi:hypothetical protein